MQSIIFPVTEIYKVNFAEVVQTENNLVYSVNGQETYVSWYGETPTFVETIQPKQGPMDENDLLQILETPDWIIFT
jgi:hypothetical protein